MGDLCRMSLEELQRVKEFKIENEHGSIFFCKPVDLTDVDLAHIITINSKVGAEVYPDNFLNKPEVGKKLN